MIKIYYDSLTELQWFISLNPIFAQAEYYLIEGRGQNPDVIENLIRYDRPDIIVLNNNQPVLVLEKTNEVPTGHNVGQRFARLVRAIEDGILTIYYFPFDAMKHGQYASMCHLNIRLLQACFRINEIHHTPLLAIDRLTDEHGELVNDGSENIRIMEIIQDFINSDFDKNCNEIQNQLNIMRSEYNSRLQARPSYSNFPKSVIMYETQDFIREFNITNPPQEFLDKNRTCVYRINMKPASCRRQDPYTGTQFIYDYLICRNGISTTDKHTNLVLYFPSLDNETWFRNNYNNPNTKSCNWYLTATALLFTDGIHYNNINRGDL